MCHDESTICGSCHEDKEDTRYVIDPHTQDVHNREVWVYLCDACYKEACADI